jgi:hypothetical protein
MGGHAAVLDAVVRRLVLAHIGRRTIRALEAGEPLAFGEVGREGSEYIL